MDILKAVLDIENKAQKIISEADELKKTEAENTEKALFTLENNAKADLKIRLAEISDSINSQLDLEKAKADDDFQNKLFSLEKHFSENKAYWLETITKNIIEGDER